MATNPITVIEESKQRLAELNAALLETNNLILEIQANSRKTGKDLFSARNPKDVNNTLKERAQNEQSLNVLLKEKQRILSNLEAAEARVQLATSKENIELQKQRFELQQLNRQAKQAAIISSSLASEYQKQSVKLIQLRSKYKDVALTQGESSAAARKLLKEVQALDAKLKSVDANVGQFQRSVGNYGIAMNNAVGAARKLASAMGLVGGAFLAVRVARDAIGVIKDFDKANATLSSVLQKTREQTKALSDDAQRLGAITVKTASEVTELQIAYARLGFSQEEILNLTEATIQGSIALNANLAETAELTGAVVNSFDEFTTTDAPEILDIMSLATAKSALNFEKLQTGIPIVGGAANAAGVPFTKLTALLGKLADSGIDVSSSATALRNIFIESAAQGLNYGQILEKIKGSTDKLTASNDEFGKRAAVSAAVLANNIEKTDELDEALQNAAGTAQQMADKELDTLSGSLDLLKSAWQGFILGADESSGAATKLKNAIKFLADNLKTILNTLIIGTKVWIAYKAAVILANAQKKLAVLLTVQETAATAANVTAKEAETVAVTQATGAWARFNAVLKANALGLIIGVLTTAVYLFNKFHKTVGETADALHESNQAFIESANKTNETNQNMTQLVDRYEELKKKAEDLGGVTKLTTAEQKELNKIIKELKKNFPGATEVVDENSEALGINADAVRKAIGSDKEKEVQLRKANKFIKEQTTVLEELTEKQEAFNGLSIENNEQFIRGFGTIKKVDGEYKKLTQTISKTGKVSLDWTTLTEKQTIALGEADLANQKRIETIKDDIQANENLIGTITGVLTQEQERQRLDELREKAISVGLKEAEITDLTYDALKKLVEEKEKNNRVTANTEDILKKLQKEAKIYENTLKELRSQKIITEVDEQTIAKTEKQLQDIKNRINTILGTKKGGKAQKTEIDYEFKVDEASLQEVIEANKKIAEDSQQNLLTRIIANKIFEEESKKLIELRLQQEKDAVDKSKLNEEDKILAKKLLDIEYTKFYEKLEEDKLKNSQKLIADEINAIKEETAFKNEELKAQTEVLLAEREKQYLQEVIAAEGNKKELKEIEKRYNDDILKIKQDAAQKILEAKLKELQDQLKYEKDPDKIKEIERSIALLKIEQSKEATDAQIEDLKRLQEAQAEFDRWKQEQITTASNNIAEALGIDSGKVQKFLEGAIEGFDSTLEGIAAAADVAGEIVGSVFDAKIARYDEDIQKNNDYYAALLDNEQLTEQQRSALEAERDAKNAELEKKKRQEEIKKAKFEKLNAIFQIGVSTATGIAKAIAASPLTGGLPWSAIVAALGAAQIAAVLARQIPKYKGGRLGGPEEVAWVGDGGVSEIIEKPNKDISITPPNPTLVKLGRGDRVYSNAEEYINSVDDKHLYENMHRHIALANLINNNNRFRQQNDDSGSKAIVKAIEKNRTQIRIINQNNMADMAKYWKSYNDTL